MSKFYYIKDSNSSNQLTPPKPSLTSLHTYLRPKFSEYTTVLYLLRILKLQECLKTADVMELDTETDAVKKLGAAKDLINVNLLSPHTKNYSIIHGSSRRVVLTVGGYYKNKPFGILYAKVLNSTSQYIGVRAVGHEISVQFKSYGRTHQNLYLPTSFK